MEQVELVRVKAEDLDELHKMQYDAFMPLYEIYHDDMSPVNESKERVLYKIENSHFYYIVFEGSKAGAVRVVRERGREDDKILWISPIFILPEFQNKGLGGKTIMKLFRDWKETEMWKLATIKQEPRNCHLYEKLGFVRFGDEIPVNDLMTLVNYEKRITGADLEA